MEDLRTNGIASNSVDVIRKLTWTTSKGVKRTVVETCSLPRCDGVMASCRLVCAVPVIVDAVVCCGKPKGQRQQMVHNL